jgi:hypothetical protein
MLQGPKIYDAVTLVAVRLCVKQKTVERGVGSTRSFLKANPAAGAQARRKAILARAPCKVSTTEFVDERHGGIEPKSSSTLVSAIVVPAVLMSFRQC